MSNPKPKSSQLCEITPNLLATQTFIPQEQLDRDVALGKAEKKDYPATQDDTILDAKIHSSTTQRDVMEVEARILAQNNANILIQEIDNAGDQMYGNNKVVTSITDKNSTLQTLSSAIRIATGIALFVGGGYVGLNIAAGTGLTFFAMSVAVSIAELGIGVTMQYDVNSEGQLIDNLANSIRRKYNDVVLPTSLNATPDSKNRNYAQIVQNTKFKAQVELARTAAILRQAPLDFNSQYTNVQELFLNQNPEIKSISKISLLQFSNFLLDNNNAQKALNEYYKTQPFTSRDRKIKLETILTAIKNVLAQGFESLEKNKTTTNPFSLENIQKILLDTQNLGSKSTTSQQATALANDIQSVLPVIYNFITKDFESQTGTNEAEQRKTVLTSLIRDYNLSKQNIQLDHDLSRDFYYANEHLLAKQNPKNNVAKDLNKLYNERLPVEALDQHYSYDNYFSLNRSTNPTAAKANLFNYLAVIQDQLKYYLPEINVYSLDQAKYVKVNAKSSTSATQVKKEDGGIYDFISIFKQSVMPIKGRAGGVIYTAISDVYKEATIENGKLKFKTNEQDGIYTELEAFKKSKAKLVIQDDLKYYEQDGKIYGLYQKHYSTSTNTNDYKKTVQNLAKVPTYTDSQGKLQFGLSADKAITFKLYIPSLYNQRILAITSPSDMYMEDYYNLIQANIKARNIPGYTKEQEKQFNLDSNKLLDDYDKKLNSLNINSSVAYNVILPNGELSTIELNSNLKGVINPTDEVSEVGTALGDNQEVVILNAKGQLVNTSNDVLGRLENFSSQSEIKSKILQGISGQSKLSDLFQKSSNLQLVETNYNNTSLDEASTAKIYDEIQTIVNKTGKFLNIIAPRGFENDDTPTRVDETSKYRLFSTLAMPRTVSANAFNQTWQQLYGGRNLIAQRRTSEGAFAHLFENQSVIENKATINSQTNSLTRAKSDMQNWSDMLPNYSLDRAGYLEGREYGDQGLDHYLNASANPLKTLSRHWKEANANLERKFLTDHTNSMIISEYHVKTKPLDAGSEVYVPVAVPKNDPSNSSAVQDNINKQNKLIVDLDQKLKLNTDEIIKSESKLNEAGTELSVLSSPLIINLTAIKDGVETPFAVNFNEFREATLNDTFNLKGKSIASAIGLSKGATLRINLEGEIINTKDSSFSYKGDEKTTAMLKDWAGTYQRYVADNWRNTRDTTAENKSILNTTNIVNKYISNLRNLVSNKTTSSIERLIISDHIITTNESSLSNNITTTKQLLKAIPEIYNDVKALVTTINPRLGISIDDSLKQYFNQESINQLAKQIGVDLSDSEIQTAFNLTNGLNKLTELVGVISKTNQEDYQYSSILRNDWQNIYDKLFPSQKPNLFNQLGKNEKISIQSIQIDAYNLDRDLVEKHSLFVPVILDQDNKPTNKIIIFNSQNGKIVERNTPSSIKDLVLATLKAQDADSSIINQVHRDNKITYYKTQDAYTKALAFNGVHLILNDQPKTTFDITNNPEDISFNIQSIVALQNITTQNKVEKLEKSIKDSFNRFQAQITDNLSKKLNLPKDSNFEDLMQTLQVQLKANNQVNSDILASTKNILTDSINQVQIQSGNISKLLRLNKAKKIYQAELREYNTLQQYSIDLNQQIEKINANKETIQHLNTLNTGYASKDRYSKHNFAGIEQINQLMNSLGADGKDLVTDTVYIPEKLAEAINYKPQGSSDKPKVNNVLQNILVTPGGKIAKYIGTSITDKMFAGLPTIIGNTLQTGVETITNNLSNIWFDIGSKKTLANFGKILVPQNTKLGEDVYERTLSYVLQTFDFDNILFDGGNSNINTLKQRSSFGTQSTVLNPNSVDKFLAKTANFLYTDKYYFTTDPQLKKEQLMMLQAGLMDASRETDIEVKKKYFTKPIGTTNYLKSFALTGFQAKNVPNMIANRLQSKSQETVARNILANYYKENVMVNFVDEGFEFARQATENEGGTLDRATFDGWIKNNDERGVHAITQVLLEKLADGINEVNSFDTVRLELIGERLSGRRLNIKDKSVIQQAAGELATVNASTRAAAYLISTLETVSYLGTAMQYGFGEMSKLKDSEGKQLISNKQIKLAQRAFYKYLFNQFNRGLIAYLVSIMFKKTVDGVAGNKILSDLYYKPTFNILQNALNTNFFASLFLHDNYVKAYYGEKAASSLVGTVFGGQAPLDSFLSTLSQATIGAVTGVQISQVLQASVIGKQLLGDSVKKYDKGDNLNKTIKDNLDKAGFPEFISIGTAGVLNFVATGTGTAKSLAELENPLMELALIKQQQSNLIRLALEQLPKNKALVTTKSAVETNLLSEGIYNFTTPIELKVYLESQPEFYWYFEDKPLPRARKVHQAIKDLDIIENYAMASNTITNQNKYEIRIFLHAIWDKAVEKAEELIKKDE